MTVPVHAAASTSALEEAVGKASAAGRVGIDTEFLRERTYRAQLCLVQIATPDDIYLVDPLEDVDLTALARVLGDPSVEKVVHAGRQDLELFYERLGVVPKGVFDVQVAAAFAGFGASLPYGRLVESVVGARLQKGESYSDWCKRPLTDAQLTYAADDVRFLLPAAAVLKEALAEQDRSSWAEEEMQRLLEDEESFRFDPQQAWKRISGRGALSGRQIAVLKEVAAWREQTAEQKDLPRGWVLKDVALVEVARRQPKTIGALQSIRGVGQREAQRYGHQVVAAVKKGQTAPPVELPKPPPRSALAGARMLSGMADGVVRARCERAQIAPELVATRSDLEGLLADVIAGDLDPEKHRLLQGWRRELAGEAVVRLVRGELAVKAKTQPPYVEEIEL